MHYSRIIDWHNYYLTGVRDTNQSSKPGIVITYFLIAAIQLQLFSATHSEELA